MSERWYTSLELAGLQGVPGTERGVKKLAERAGWTRRKRSGSKAWEYPLEALPAETRTDLATRAASAASRSARTAIALVKAGVHLTEIDKHHARVESLIKLGTSAGWVKQHIDARLAVLSAFRSYHQAQGGALTTARTLFSEAYNAGLIDVEAGVRQIVPLVSLATLLRWQTGMEKQGLQALAPRYGNRKNQCLILTQPPMHDLVVGMLTQYPHCSVTHVMQALEARRSDDPELAVPKLRTVQRFVAGWKQQNKQLFTAITNPDKWRNSYQSAAGDASAHIHHLNHEWQVDSTPGDLLLADGQRHTILGVIDGWSRRMKLHVSRTSRASAIASLLRRTFMDWGVPERIKSDNGSDYVAKHITRIYEALEIEHVLCPPFTPEKKPFIERGLGTMSHDMIELLPGFIGHNVAERKDIEARRSFAQRLMKKGETVELRMTPEQLQKMLDDWCAVYHDRVHSELEATPNSRVHGQRVRKIEDERALDMLLQPVAGGNRDGWYTITKKGVRIDRGTYNHAELGGREGTRVQALQDERDWGYVHLFDEAGQYICHAFDPERIGIAHTEVAIARRARQRDVINEGKQALRDAKKRARVEDIVPDILAHRAAAASNVVSLNPAAAYTTAALEQAAIAAQAQSAPSASLFSPELQELQEALIAEGPLTIAPKSPLAQVLDMRDGRGRWAFAKSVIARVEAGAHVIPRDLKWAQGYIKTDEFSAMEKVAPDFSLTPEGVLLDCGVSV